ncbi:MAG TPA: DUF2147 domain-containing protein [Cytophagales bacterium]|nr:DUF2147 domain-containing protein [Cytophagales bacterium]HAA17854.1 DUF2147 domain-containing protein [Cytophagales bacterium]HAP58224.1 DUF2147 domain-containing protein [Cytophagales bacterium]
MKKFLVFFLAGLFFIAGPAFAQDRNDVFRKWKTIDDNTNKPRSVIEIFEQNGKMYGKVIKLFREPGEDPNPLCTECDDDDPRYNQPVIGMVLISDMEWDADDKEWEDGEIMDPDNGSVYDCEIWIDEDTGDLRVRGYLYFLYRTQTWKPYDGD